MTHAETCMWGGERMEGQSCLLGAQAKTRDCLRFLSVPSPLHPCSSYILMFCCHPDHTHSPLLLRRETSCSPDAAATHPTLALNLPSTLSPHPCPHLLPLQLALALSLPSTVVWRSSQLAEDSLDLYQFLKTERLRLCALLS